MATITLSTTLGNSVLSTINTALNAGTGPATIKIYNGTKPASPDTAISTQTLLGTLTCSDPAAAAPASKTLTFSAITQDSAADATGTATWARLLDSDNNALIDVDITATGGGGFLQMNTTSIVIGGPILISSFVITA